MSIIKEEKTNASEALVTATEALWEYMNALEADEDFGPIFDGSTLEADLAAIADHLSEARAIWNRTHKTNHFGLA